MTRKKAPRVRWAEARHSEDGNGGWWYVHIGRAYFRFDNEHEPREFVKTVNAELSRLVAARERRKARTSSAFDRDLTSILDSAPTRKLVASEAKRRAKK